MAKTMYPPLPPSFRPWEDALRLARVGVRATHMLRLFLAANPHMRLVALETKRAEIDNGGYCAPTLEAALWLLVAVAPTGVKVELTLPMTHAEWWSLPSTSVYLRDVGGAVAVVPKREG